MIKQLISAALIAATALGAAAQHDTMYLVKGDRVVGKYGVDEVDYMSFTLPQGVIDNNLWLTIDSKGKNTVTYTVNTVNPAIAYAHNIVSYYDVNYMSLSYESASFDDLDEAKRIEMLQATLQGGAYLGMDTQTFTQTDYQLDGANQLSRFSVVPGTKYFLCAWEVDALSQKPLDNFVFTEFTTDAPGASDCKIEFSFKRLNERGVAFNIESQGVYYIRTAWGMRTTMDMYVQTYGLDHLLGTFGEVYDPDFLKGFGEVEPDVENATWPTNGNGEYVLYVRAYDLAGNITDQRLEVAIEEEVEKKGPEINIFSKEKGPGFVNVNFEISPSNVEEAYVRLCGENFVDDRLNMGYELHEVAQGGDAEDITATINRLGEYTFSAQGIDEEWKALLITALSKEGKRTTLRINFFPDTETEWSIYKPVYKAPASAKAPRRIQFRNNPTIAR